MVGNIGVAQGRASGDVPLAINGDLGIGSSSGGIAVVNGADAINGKTRARDNSAFGARRGGGKIGGGDCATCRNQALAAVGDDAVGAATGGNVVVDFKLRAVNTQTFAVDANCTLGTRSGSG